MENKKQKVDSFDINEATAQLMVSLLEIGYVEPQYIILGLMYNKYKQIVMKNDLKAYDYLEGMVKNKENIESFNQAYDEIRKFLENTEKVDELVDELPKKEDIK